MVADAGMMSQENLALLLSKGYDFVVAARLRSLGRRPRATSRQCKSGSPWEKAAWLQKGRLILRACPKKAAKDAHDRERAVEKAKLNLAQGVKGGAVGSWWWTRER